MDSNTPSWANSIIALFVGTIGGVFFGLFISSIGDPSPKLEAVAGILSGLMLSVLTAQLQSTQSTYSMNNSIKELNNVAARAYRLNILSTNVQRQVSNLAKHPSITQETSIKALEMALGSFEFAYDGSAVKIGGRRLSHRSYTYFWEQILDYQKKSKKKLNARITHSTELSILKDRSTNSLNAIHEQFSKSGNIMRVFIDVHKQDQFKILDFINIIKNMNQHGINCCYINISGEEILRNDFETKEFCIIDGIHYSAEWHIRTPREVDSFSLGIDKKMYRDNLSDWNKLISYIKGYDYGKNSIEAIYENDLNNFRDILIKNNP